MADSTLHPNCAFLPGSTCDGIVLQEGGRHIGLLGDRKVELLGIDEQSGLAAVQVRVSEPGLSGETTLVPTFDVAGGHPADTPAFPGLRYRLTVEEYDAAAGMVRLNIAAPGTGTLENASTLITFLASIFGFTGLFLWLFQVRSTLLGVQWRLEQRKGAAS
jgi:heme exporter protein C